MPFGRKGCTAEGLIFSFSNEEEKRAGKDENLQGARAARLRLQNVTSKIKPGSAFLLAPEKTIKSKRKRGGKRGGRVQDLCGTFEVEKRNLKN